MVRSILFVTLVLSSFGLARGLAADQTKAAPRPNVLFIAVDDLNHWVGHLGRNKQTKTPNLDRLATLGTTFTRAYCAAPVCNPSRTALMSGRRPSASGVYANGNDWRPVINPEWTLNGTFRRAGYHVCGAGKIYHGAYERDTEWNDYLHSDGNPRPAEPFSAGPLSPFGPVDAPETEWSDHKSVDYGIAELNKSHDKPFFVAVGLHKPHMPWTVPRKYFEIHPLDQIELPPYREDDLDDLPPAAVEMAKPREHESVRKGEGWKRAVQAYLAAVSYADAEIGRLIDAYEKSPQRHKTVLVLWGDHGWHLGEKHHWRKFALWEEATRAPFIWVVPGVTKAGTRCERTVDFMSIYPTLCDLCGVQTPEHVQGTSIRQLLTDPNSTWDRLAVTTHGRNNHAVRSEGWRYIRYEDGGEELYDETADPYEWTNLAGDSRYQAEKQKLAAYLPQDNVPEASGGQKNKPGKAKKRAKAGK